MKKQLEVWRERLGRGERRLGWKIGMAAPQIREKLGIARPLIGFMTSASLIDTGGAFSIAGTIKPASEPEFAVTLDRDVPGGASAETAAAAISHIAPAIELVDVDRPMTDVAEMLSINIFHRGVIFGDWISRRGGHLKGVLVRISRNGILETTNDPTTYFGTPAEFFQVVADTLAAQGEMLRAGDRIICGAVVPVIPAVAGDRIEVALEVPGETSGQPAVCRISSD
jgi:2-keto-4-pentenoate hydratase